MAAKLLDKAQSLDKFHNKQHAEYDTEHDSQNKLMAETSSTLLKSVEFDNVIATTTTTTTGSNSNDYPSTSLAPLSQNGSLVDIVCKEEEKNQWLTTKTQKVGFPSSFDQNVPFYVSKAYCRFAYQLESKELKGLKFIGIIRFGLSTIDDPHPYLWHHTEKLTMTTTTTTNNNSDHNHNHGHYEEEVGQKEFSYSVVKFDKFTKTKEQLKTDQDKWILLFLRGSEMTEKEVEEIFQMLKLNKLTSEELQKYHRLEKIRHYNEESMRFHFEKSGKEGLNMISPEEEASLRLIRQRSEESFEMRVPREESLSMGRKIRLEIDRRRALNEAVVIEDIVGPIVDESFDQQGTLKLDTEKNQWIAMSLQQRQGSSIQDVNEFQEKWTEEEIEKLKKGIIDGLERLGLA
jgi:hypothetical protein